MRRQEPEEETFRRLTWAFVILTVVIGLFGYFSDNKTLLMLCVLCAGLAFLCSTCQSIFSGQIRGRCSRVHSDDNPLTFSFLALIQFSCAAFLIVFPILVICGVVELSLEDAKSFVRIWERKPRH